MTEAESKLWLHLRSRQVGGVKFRRQQPLEGCIVDFCSVDPKLVIEVDGGQHAEKVAEDAERTAILERMGYRVIRFWNHEVLSNAAGVIAVIEQEIVRLRGQKRR